MYGILSPGLTGITLHIWNVLVYMLTCLKIFNFCLVVLAVITFEIKGVALVGWRIEI